MFKARVVCHECGYDTVPEKDKDRPTVEVLERASAEMKKHKIDEHGKENF